MEKEKLRGIVLKVAGIENLKPRHCAILSELIYEKTNKRISITTLKRFYGFIIKPVQTSAYTLHALTEYGEGEQK